MEAQANQNMLRDFAKRCVTVVRTFICLDAEGREIPSAVEEWPEPPYAPTWSPYYATAQRLRKRWEAAQRSTPRDARPGLRSTAGGKHGAAAALPIAPVEGRAELPGAREDWPLSAAEQKLIRFLSRSAIAAWSRKN